MEAMLRQPTILDLDRRRSYAVVVQGRLLEHLLKVLDRGCLGAKDCVDCAAIRKGVILAEAKRDA